MATLSFLDAPLHELPWTVTSITGVEAVSALYRFEVTATCPRDAAEALLHDAPLEEVALGRRVRLGFGGDEHAPAARYGIAGAVTVTGLTPAEVSGVEGLEVRVEVEPRARILSLRTRSRVYQDRYVHDIVSEVLAAHEVRHRWAFRNVYPRRVYCVQYQESDWDFIARLLAEEGIFFYFLHGAFDGAEREPPEPVGAWERAREYAAYAGYASHVSSGMGGALGAVAGASALAADVIASEAEDERDLPITPRPGGWGPEGEGEVLVLVDHAAFYARSIAPEARDAEGGALTELVLRERDAGVVDARTLTDFAPRRALRTARVELREVFFQTPLAVYRAEHEPRVPERALSKDLEHYAHHGEHERPDVSAENARNALEALRADAATWSARGRDWSLTAGQRVAVHNETHRPVRDGRYAVARVEHRWQATPAAEGGAAAAYHNTLACVGDEVPLRPPRPSRAPRATTELATVVGPPDREVYTDRFGRVRAQLHWDRENRFLPASSCWLRVAQPWAGAGFGVHFLPRVGMEVVVSFVGGDPDRPVITGALYNGTHPTPEHLPEHATRSSIRTQTVPGGGGFNELSFEDARGAERVYLHAEKSLDVDVGDGHRTTVRGAQADVVTGAREVAVGGAMTHAVGGARTATVGGDDGAVIGGDRRAFVAGGVSERVRGNALTHREGTQHDLVGRDAVRAVGGTERSYALAGRVAMVGDAVFPADDLVRVEGDATTLAARSVRVSAGLDPDAESPALRLQVGASSLALTREAAELIAADTANVLADTVILVTADGGSGLSLSASGVELWGPQVTLRTGGASVSVDGGGVAVVGSSRVRVESPDIAFAGGSESHSDDASEPQATVEPNLRLLLSHGRWRDGVRPLAAGTVCRVTMRALTKDITLERAGELDLYVPDGVTHVEVSAVPMDGDDTRGYGPDDLPLRWSVRVVSDEPKTTLPDGVRWRLADLGYAVGHFNNDALNATTRASLRRFQRDQRLAVTGEADEETRARLDEVYAP